MRRGLLSEEDSASYASMGDAAADKTSSSSSSSSSSFTLERFSPAVRSLLAVLSGLLLLAAGVGVGWLLHSSTTAASNDHGGDGHLPASRVQSPLVLYISINGFRASYVDWYARDYLPAFRYLLAHGLHAREMTPVVPTVTYPNHYTLSTGLWPESHGVVSNSMYDPYLNATFQLGRPSEADGRWYDAEPVWVTAKRQGRRTAVHFWAGSDAEIAGVRPDSYTTFHGVDDDADFPDQQRLINLTRLIEAGDCALCMLHLDNIDHNGHAYGPYSNRTLSALITYDNLLRQLLDWLQARGLRQSTHLVLVSDHGMAADVSAQSLAFSDYSNVSFTSTDTGAFSALWTANDSDAQRLYDDLRRMPHARAWLKQQSPSGYHYGQHRRIAPVLVQSDESWQLYRRPRPAGNGGSHGSAPLHTPHSSGHPSSAAHHVSTPVVMLARSVFPACTQLRARACEHEGSVHSHEPVAVAQRDDGHTGQRARVQPRLPHARHPSRAPQRHAGHVEAVSHQLGGRSGRGHAVSWCRGKGT